MTRDEYIARVRAAAERHGVTVELREPTEADLRTEPKSCPRCEFDPSTGLRGAMNVRRIGTEQLK